MKCRLPGRETVAVDGATTEYSLAGQTGPVLVLLHGFRMPLASWDRLYPETEYLRRILAYNRHGIGRTAKALFRQTDEAVVGSLERVLIALSLSPPCILVAHSFGGIFANLYAHLKLRDIAAVVFVGAAHPDERKRQEGFRPPLFIRIINATLKALDTVFDKYQHSEDECAAETVRQIEAAGDLPPIPVAVITGGRKTPFVTEASFTVHLQCQKELTWLSPFSTQLSRIGVAIFPNSLSRN